LLQRRIGELHLRLDSRHTRNDEPVRSPRGGVDQHRLSDPGLAPHDEHAAPPRSGAFDQCRQRAEFIPAPDQLKMVAEAAERERALGSPW
jgi:hypothetical protein